MPASQRIPRPREVLLVGVIQPTGIHSAFATPSISAPPDVELVWRQVAIEEVDDTLDLLFVTAVNATVPAVSRAIARVRASGWNKGVLAWVDRSQLAMAHKFIAAGATDFIAADAESDEAASRLHAALYRPPSPAVQPRPSEGVRLDWKRRMVLMGEIRVPLTLRELQLLDVMLQTTSPIPPLALAQRAWGRIPGDSANLVVVRVCSLRKKLARFGGDFGIRTHRGLGYSAEVRRA